MDRKKLIRDTLIVLFALELFLVQEHLRGAQVPTLWILAAVPYGIFLAILAQTPRIRGERYGGWLMFFTAFTVLYLWGINPPSFTLSSLYNSAVSHFAWSYAIQKRDAEWFALAYTVIATSGFTLFGIFFIVVRRINAYVALRLILISTSLLAASITSTLALTFRAEPWWRVLLLILFAGTTIYNLGTRPAIWIADYLNDDPTTIAFWQAWINQRAGWSRLPLFGLAVMPIWPVLGEWLLLFGMLSQVVLAAYGASFLYLNENTRTIPGFADLLSRLLRIRIPTGVVQATDKFRQYKRAPGGVTSILFFNIDPPTQTPPTNTV